MMQERKSNYVKNLIGLFMMTLLVFLFPIMSHASQVVGTYDGQDLYQEGDWCYILNEDGESVSITGWKGTDTTVVVPNMIDGKVVSKIMSETFFGSETDDVPIENLTIPDGINIEDVCFCGMVHGWRNLKNITLPEGLTNIKFGMFVNCSSLEKITIPNSVKSIGENAFYGCSSLKSIVIPEGVTSIGRMAFLDCKSLSSITIPSSVVEIGASCIL